MEKKKKYKLKLLKKIKLNKTKLSKTKLINQSKKLCNKKKTELQKREEESLNLQIKIVKKMKTISNLFLLSILPNQNLSNFNNLLNKLIIKSLSRKIKIASRKLQMMIQKQVIKKEEESQDKKINRNQKK